MKKALTEIETREEELEDIVNMLAETKSDDGAIEYIAGCITRKVVATLFSTFYFENLLYSLDIPVLRQVAGQPFRVMVD